MSNADKTIIVTGAAGFIGSSLVKRLIENGKNVIGIDDLNSYYDPSLKEDRVKEIVKTSSKFSGSWTFYHVSILNYKLLEDIFREHSPKVVVNLAAQAGVRYSLENPSAYIQTNLLGFWNVIENCRKSSVNNFIYASSSSVYGGNTNLPFTESQPTNHPVSLYAATKKSNELIAHSYSHLYNLPSTGLRFFTVYGPWGRPDMAPMIFAKAIMTKTPINIYNNGKMRRDFTYIDDVVESVLRCIGKPSIPNKSFDTKYPDPSISFAPHSIFNIGNSSPIELLRFIELLENELDIKAIKNFKPMQPGDVVATAADVRNIHEWIGFSPETPIETGIEHFVDWFKNYYHN